MMFKLKGCLLTVFLLLNFTLAFSVTEKTLEQKIVYMNNERILVMTNGEYYYGKLLRIFKEGVLFDPGVEMNWDDRHPTFYPYISVLHIRDINGRTYTPKILESIAKTSIKDYDLPYKVNQFMQKKISKPFHLNLQFGLSQNSVIKSTAMTYMGPVEFENAGNQFDYSIDLNYMLCEYIGLGIRFDYKSNKVEHQFHPDTSQNHSPLGPSITEFSKFTIIAPFNPKINIMKTFGKFRFSGSALLGMVYVRELPDKGKYITKLVGWNYGGVAEIDYIINNSFSIGCAYNYYQYQFKKEHWTNGLFNYKNMHIHSAKLGFKYYFDW